MVAVTVVSSNEDLLVPFLDSLHQHRPRNCELKIFLAWNAPGRGGPPVSPDLARRYPDVTIVESSTSGFPANQNLLLHQAKADYYLVINDDVIFLPGSIDKPLDYLERPENADVGMLAIRLLNRDGTLQPSTYSFAGIPRALLAVSGLRSVVPLRASLFPLAAILGMGRGRSQYWPHSETLEVETFRGSYMLVRGAALDQVGPLDVRGGHESEWHIRFEKHGWKRVFFHDAQVIHLKSMTVATDPESHLTVLRSYLNIYYKHRSTWRFALLRLGCLAIYLVQFGAAKVTGHQEDASTAGRALTMIRSWPIDSATVQVCSNCVMDTTDTKIVFDDRGVCDHCRTYYEKTLPNWHPDARGAVELDQLIVKIKRAGRGHDFDCIIGVSGGIDSSYLAYLAKKRMGLRPLVFHVDAGWNSQVAANNIEKLVDKLGLELFTEVIDWNEMRDLQLAYLKSGVPYIDAPQDFAFFYTMYKFAHKHNVKYILTGANLSTECIRNPVEWSYYGDSVQMHDIHEKFGTVPLTTFPSAHILWHKLYLPYVRGIRVVRPLNYFPYIKADAVRLLIDEIGWQPYPQKHFESRYTRFVEAFWLPTRFGYDTRKVQYSALILTGQMTREEALSRLQSPAFDAETIDQEFEYVATKLGITLDELGSYLTMPKKSYRDYRSQEWLFLLGATVMKAFGLEVGGKR